MAWIASPLKVYDPQTRLVVLIPHTIMKCSQRPGKFDRERKVQSTGFAHFWPLPLHGCWMSFGIGRSVQTPDKAPLLGAAFSHYQAWQNCRARLNAHFLLISVHLCHSTFTQTGTPHRVSKVKQKTCILRKQRA